MAILFWFVIVPVGALVYFFFTSYNKLQAASQQVKEGASNIQVMLRKKLELTIQLMDTCKGYQGHEQLVNLKVSADMADSFKNIGAANARAEQAMAFMTQMASRFPELKADTQYTALNNRLAALGNELQSKREWFNRFVRDYNTLRTTAPTVFIARAMNFPEAQYFNTDENMDVLQTFVTDDGAKLEAFLGSIGSKLSSGASAVAEKAKSAGSAAVEISKEKFSKKKYRYSIGGKPSDPIDRKQLDELAKTGTINEKTYVIEDGGKTWFTVGDLTTKDATLPPLDAGVPLPPDAK